VHTSNWFDEIKDLQREDAIFALVGNKLDSEDKRQVTTEELENLGKQRNVLYHEVSAKTGTNINSLFYKEIFEQIIVKFQKGMNDEDKESKFNKFIYQRMLV
jgi:GTPase SAR1 family protein